MSQYQVALFKGQWWDLNLQVNNAPLKLVQVTKSLSVSWIILTYRFLVPVQRDIPKMFMLQNWRMINY